MATRLGEREIRYATISSEYQETSLPAVELRKVRTTRPRGRRLKKRQSMAEDIFKLSALVIGLVLLVVFFVHDGSYDDFDTSRAAGYHSVDKTQGAFVAQYLSYQGDVAHNPGLGGRTKVDTSGVYVDAKGVVPDSIGETIDTGTSGTPITVGGPTMDLTAAAYVVNIEQLAVWMYQDIIDSEYKRDIEPITTAKKCARELLTETNGRILFSPENDDGTDSLAGAVGPAITRRDYIDNRLWEKKQVTQAETFYGAFPDKNSSEAYIDIMFVPSDEADKYYAGEDVTVYYVQWRVNDAKAHSAPWGLAQTNIHYAYDGPNTQFAFIDGRYGKPKEGVGTWGDTDYVATTPRTADAGEAFHNLMTVYLDQDLPTYRAPAVSAEAEQLNDANYIGLQEVFEYRDNVHWTALKTWYDAMQKGGGLACVGVLVYATNDVTSGG